LFCGTIFQQFVEFIENKMIEVGTFPACYSFPLSLDFSNCHLADHEARNRIPVLEEHVSQQEHAIAELTLSLSRLVAEFSEKQTDLALLEMQTTTHVPAPNDSAPPARSPQPTFAPEYSGSPGSPSVAPQAFRRTTPAISSAR
jgi:uncharacterized coiled-coil protein SlyX